MSPQGLDAKNISPFPPYPVAYRSLTRAAGPNRSRLRGSPGPFASRTYLPESRLQSVGFLDSLPEAEEVPATDSLDFRVCKPLF